MKDLYKLKKVMMVVVSFISSKLLGSISILSRRSLKRQIVKELLMDLGQTYWANLKKNKILFAVKDNQGTGNLVRHQENKEGIGMKMLGQLMVFFVFLSPLVALGIEVNPSIELLDENHEETKLLVRQYFKEHKKVPEADFFESAKNPYKIGETGSCDYGNVITKVTQSRTLLLRNIRQRQPLEAFQIKEILDSQTFQLRMQSCHTSLPSPAMDQVIIRQGSKIIQPKGLTQWVRESRPGVFSIISKAKFLYSDISLKGTATVILIPTGRAEIEFEVDFSTMP